MCKFRPFNKHVLVEKFAEKKIEDSSPVLIPEGVKLEDNERYGLVKFIRASSDCDRFLLNLNQGQDSWATQTGTMDDVFTTSAKTNGNSSLVVEKSMIEQVIIQGKTFHVVHQNYIVGAIDE